MPINSFNPAALLAGAAGVPLLTNALARTFIAPAPIQTQEQADAELRRLMSNFALYNAAAALGLGYFAMQSKNETAKSVAFGGAAGSLMLATLLGAGLLTGPKPPEPVTVNALPATVRVRAPADWINGLVGLPR